jgi:S1-C subfamily serine protease
MLRTTIGKWMARALACLLLTAAGAGRGANHITECSVDGTSYKNIFDVHEAAGGRVSILYHIGGITVDRSKLSKEFLESWGLSAVAAPKPAPAQDDANAEWYRAKVESDLQDAVRAGQIRRMGQAMYDLRKSPPGWETFTDARILYFSGLGAVLEVPNRPANSRIVVVMNLPMVRNENERVTATAKLVGLEKRVVRNMGEITVGCYDYGKVCTRDEVPMELLNTGIIEEHADLWASGRNQSPAAAEMHHVRKSGSGFFVSQDGLFMTSCHVVADAGTVRVRYGDKVLASEVVRLDRTNDVALLKVKGSGFKYLPLAGESNAKLGDSVFTIGYPNPTMQGLEAKYSEGIVNGLDGLRDDPREYQVSVAVQPGNSGGPLCNVRGEVVGMIRAELNARYAMAHSGTVPQNVNYAVKSKYLLDLLESAQPGGDFGADVSSAVEASVEKVHEHAQEAVAMVLVN